MSSIVPFNKKTYRKSYRIRSRFRFCMFITVLLLFLLSLLTPLLLKGNAMGEPQLKIVRVEEGDTLWAIARRTLPRGRDIRDYIIEIKDINSLKDANIFSGTDLRIPIYDGRD
jgi:hypothetical protein